MSEQQQIPPQPPPPPSGPAPANEHDLAFWAHLAGGILCLICLTAFLAWIPGLILYLTNKDKSKFVGFHALQALILHGAAAVINFMLWIPGMLGLFFLTVPLAFLINVGVFAYSLIVGMKAKDGQWAEYLVIGDFVRGQFPQQD